MYRPGDLTSPISCLRGQGRPDSISRTQKISLRFLCTSPVGVLRVMLNSGESFSREYIVPPSAGRSSSVTRSDFTSWGSPYMTAELLRCMEASIIYSLLALNQNEVIWRRLNRHADTCLRQHIAVNTVFIVCSYVRRVAYFNDSLAQGSTAACHPNSHCSRRESRKGTR